MAKHITSCLWVAMIIGCSYAVTIEFFLTKLCEFVKDEIVLGFCISVTFFICLFPLGMVDVVFADVAQPDQARIVAINAHHFLKNQGHFVISIKAS